MPGLSTIARAFGLLVALAGPLPVAAQQAEALRAALEARATGDWPEAVRLGARAGPVGRDVIEWHRLRAGQGTFDETLAFLARRPDWPGLPLLRARSEPRIPEGARANEVQAFFATQAPRTGAGALALAAALNATGEGRRAAEEVVRAWTSLPMGVSDENAFLALYGDIVDDHHAARVDWLLWEGEVAAARRLVPRLSEGAAALAEARIALQTDAGGYDARIAAVPAALAADPGLAYDRFRWRAERGRADAITLMEQTTELGRPEAWGNLRRRYARQLMRDGQARRAYALAANHGLSEGRHFADLEWLAGYVALRKRRDAATALRHFERFETAVDTPISLARAAYWQGRAHEAAGDGAAARADYLRGAEHQTAFYGLLAAEKAGVGMDPALVGDEAFADWRGAPFTGSSVFEAAILLLDAGDLSLGERFLTHLTESLPRDQIGQLATFARDRGEPHLEVMIAKRAVRYGSVIEGPYFPLHPLVEHVGDSGVAPELALAIARRESEFDPGVASGVGARGLMQVMPRTAEEVAGWLGEPFDAARLFSDPDYNARLGIRYLAELQARFGPSPVLVAAGYNAGPSRPAAWIERYGDPRRSRFDVVDWIEHIPFRETRNYVMRVTESLPIYRARLAGEVVPLAFTELLRGGYPAADFVPSRAQAARLQTPEAAPTPVPATEAAEPTASSVRPALRPSAGTVADFAAVDLADTTPDRSVRPVLRP
ncbi:MAG: lytic transglycosylase domain-containing protein [Shimia sp.]